MRRTPAQWQEIIADFERSGLTQRAFCKTRGLSEHYFSKRFRRLKNGPEKPRAFVPVQVRSEGIAVELGDVTVRGTTAISVVWIADLAAALRR